MVSQISEPSQVLLIADDLTIPKGGVNEPLYSAGVPSSGTKGGANWKRKRSERKCYWDVLLVLSNYIGSEWIFSSQNK